MCYTNEPHKSKLIAQILQTGTTSNLLYTLLCVFIFDIMNKQLEELFGKHFNGLHYEDITKEMMFKFAVDYVNIKVEVGKQLGSILKEKDMSYW